MGARKRRAADRAGRPAMRSPGRPPVGRREHRQRFWVFPSQLLTIEVLRQPVESATLALVLITAHYAWQTQRMVREMRDSRELSVLPRITIDLTYLGPLNAVPTLTNVGSGPALNTDLQIVFEPVDPDAHPPEVRRLRWNVIAPGERIRLFPPDAEGNQLMTTDEMAARYARVRVQGTAEDSLRNQRPVDHCLKDLQQWSQLIRDTRVLADEPPAREIAKEVKALAREMRDTRREIERLWNDLAEGRPATNGFSSTIP
jgi:hypothetical protein